MSVMIENYRAFFLAVAILLLSACASKPDLTCSVIHEPKMGCPSGYAKEEKPRFTERGGSKVYACVSHDVRKEGCTDVLYPGESEEFLIIIEQPAPPKKPQSKL